MMTSRKVNGKPLRTSRVEVPVNPNDGHHEIMAVGGQSWGRGVDATAARVELRKQCSDPVAKYMVVPKGAWIDSMGTQVLWKTPEGATVHADGSCPLCTIR